ncbi:MAG: hypothetical protein FJX75_12825 [Armatimonadetes bacterium]|nr:hypothetical protein [Armatimonadota bacterium]
MATLARVIIAIIVGPGVGAAAGQGIARAIGDRAGLEAGTVARWEMSGMLVGLLVGVLFGVLVIRCVTGFEGRLRHRLADPVLLPPAALLVLSLLGGQGRAPADVLAVIRWTMTVVWVLGLLLLLTSLRYRPPVPVPEPIPEEAPEPEWPEEGRTEPVDDETWRRYVSEEVSDE